MAASASARDPRVVNLVRFFEQLTQADLKALATVYAEDARFKDPFNDVAGIAAIEQVFAHMYAALDEPRFAIVEAIVDGDQCVLVWDFLFRFKRCSRALQTVRGASHLRFDAQGRVALHRDYWDAAEELYEKLPLLGTLMRWLRRRAAS
jgi:ketosteroid isomerase-like protein